MKNRSRKYKPKPKTAPKRTALKADPTRTSGLRRRFAAAIKRKFALLRRAIVELVAGQDVFGLKPRQGWQPPKYPQPVKIVNADGENCGTGAGGFQPGNTCGKGGGSLSSAVESAHDKAVLKVDTLSKDREHAVVMDAKTGEVLEEESGPLAAGLDWAKGETPSVSAPYKHTSEGRNIVHVHTHMDEHSSFSDGDWGIFASKNIVRMTVVDKYNIYTIEKPTSYVNAEKSKYTPRQLREAWNDEINEVEKVTDAKDGELIGDTVARMIHMTNERMAKRFGFNYSWKPKSRPTMSFNSFCPTGEGGGVDPSCSPPTAQDIQASTHKVSDVILGRQVVGVRGGSKDMERARAAGLYTTVVRGTEIYAKDEQSARPLVEYLRQGGKYGTLQFSRLLGYTEEEVGQYERFLRTQGRDDLLDLPRQDKDSHRDHGRLDINQGRSMPVRREVPGGTVLGRRQDLRNLGEGHPFQTRLTTNDHWRFRTSADKVKEFQGWLKKQYGTHLLGQDEKALWEKYVEEGWKRGAGRAWDDVKGGGKKGGRSHKSLDFYKGSREEFLRSSFNRRETVEKVKLLAGRSFDDLENVTADMSTRMSRVLTDGLVRGAHPDKVARKLAAEVDIGETRAKVIAHQEFMRVHAESTLDSLEAMGVAEVGVAVEWEVTDDEKLCPRCEAMRGVILSIQEARGLFPLHVGCRCQPIPANVGESTIGQKRSKSEIEDAAAEGDVEISIGRDRPTSIFNAFYPVANPKTIEEI